MVDSLKKIAVVTATRAEYGLLSHLIQQLHHHPKVALQLFVTGAHLLPEQGDTVEAIRQSGVPITAEIPIINEATQPAQNAMAQITSEAVAKFSEAFLHDQPDCVVILGDRYEILGVATAALLNQIPIAHLHGGEITLGAVDDAIRHAITKMASLHFVAAEPYRQRVIQMGELPERVLNVGAMGLDVIQQTAFLSQSELEKHLGLRLTHPLLLVTYHPETWTGQSPETSLNELFAAMETFSKKYGQITVIWTGANLDAAGEQINQKVQQQIQQWQSHAHIHALYTPSLGSQRYLSLMKLADLVIGNSSSGIIEAPALQTATVNIGQRQAGRLMANSIFQANPSLDSILQAMENGINFNFSGGESLYGQGESAQKVVETLVEQDFSQLLPKPFVDLNCR
ncbi:UDP-N-acetylglucosamine 2-epimerase [Galenea microaerophila]